jgi:hypothetical protein
MMPKLLAHRFGTAVSLVALALGAFGCQEQTPEPRVASSASMTGYALDYPGEVDRNVAGFSGRKDELAQIDVKLPDYADQLKDPKSIALALTVMKKAEASGRSQAYVDRVHELDGVGTFFDEEGPAISNKVAGAAQYAVKQKECDVNAGGAAAAALKPAVGKQIEKRAQKRNEAWLLIDRERTALPKEDVAVLEKMADDIARASYIAYVELVERKVRLRRLVAEASDVRSASAELIENEKSWQGEPGRTDADKKASEARIEAAKKSKAAADDAVVKAKDMDKDKALDKNVSAAQSELENALDSLKKKLKAKKG